MSKSSSTTQFLLLAFADTRELQLLHFWLFLGIYLAALLGNGLIITAVACDHQAEALGGGGVGEKGAWERGEHGEMGDRDGDGGEKGVVLGVRMLLLCRWL